MSVLKVKNGNQWDIVPAIKGDPGDPAADESITDDMLVTDGIKTEIEWLWGNQLMDSREGELLHAEDAYTAPAVDISVDGKSTQVTTTGKNLLNPDFSYWTSYNLPDIGTRKGILIPVNTGTYNYHNLSNIDMMYGWVDDADNVESTYIDGAHITQHLNAGTQIVADGTHPFILIYTYTGTPQQNIYDRQSMLEYGTTNTGYEPYSGGKPSPSPDYPQEIVSMDEPELMLAGKNLLCDYREGYTLSGNQCIYSIPVASGATYVYSRLAGNSNILDFVVQGSNEPLSVNPSAPYVSLITLTYYTNWTYTANGQYKYLNFKFNIANFNENPTIIRDRQGQFELGSVATVYTPYVATTTVPLYDGTLRSLPDGTKDELHLSYLRPSKRAGWAWYSRELTALVGETTTAATDGITGTVGVDVMSTTGEIADGPTVLYLLATPITETLDPIELPIMPSRTINVWSDPATNLKMTYIQDSNLIIENLEATIADIAMS